VNALPITPFHYPLAYLVYKFGKQKLSLPALIVGSMLPDLEIPVMALLFGLQAPNRMVLHSLLGGVTIGTVIGVAITVLIYPTITSAIFRFSKSKVKDKCRFSPFFQVENQKSLNNLIQTDELLFSVHLLEVEDTFRCRA